MKVIDLERYLLKKEEWGNVPTYVREHLHEGMENGIPTGVGYHNIAGWFVLSTAGQGPVLVWSQYKIPNLESD